MTLAKLESQSCAIKIKNIVLSGSGFAVFPEGFKIIVIMLEIRNLRVKLRLWTSCEGFKIL